VIPARIPAVGYCASAEVALLGVIPSGEQLLEARGCSVAGRWGYGVEEVHGRGARARLVQRAGRRGRREVEEGNYFVGPGGQRGTEEEGAASTGKQARLTGGPGSGETGGRWAALACWAVSARAWAERERELGRCGLGWRRRSDRAGLGWRWGLGQLGCYAVGFWVFLSFLYFKPNSNLGEFKFKFEFKPSTQTKRTMHQHECTTMFILEKF